MLSPLKKIKNVVNSFRTNRNLITDQLAELEWAHIYKETIRGRTWLEELSISPGRWAGNYSFFYVLTKILSDYNPQKIIEFGLGESTKVVSTFVKNELKNSTHLVVEQSSEWIIKFNSRFSLSENTTVLNLAMKEKIINTFPVNVYDGIREHINETFDLYIIDGPFGSHHFSRYDICYLAEKFQSKDEFIILFDDFNRQGEKETVGELISIINRKGIKIYTGEYFGNKAQLVIVTEKYKYATTL